MSYRTFCISANFLFVTVLLFADAHLTAQDDFFQRSNLALKAGNRLLAVESLRQGIEKVPGMEDLITQYLPLISDYEPTTPYAEAITTPARNEAYVERLKEEIGNAERLDAIKAIVDLARERQVVILNEAHDCPQHRAFGLLLAIELRKVGFDVMAMETLVGPERKPGPVEFDYPTLETGYYSAEPVFGDFVRQTAQLGYQLVAYEIDPNELSAEARKNPIESIKVRENAQSNNLIKQVIEKRPDAKLFVYVGYSHATEHWETLEDGSRLGWMAAQIKEKTGIDPLTIDQVGGSYNPKGQHVDPVLRIVESHASIDQPVVLKDGAQAWINSDSYFQKTDLTVFHPVQIMVDGRPNWLRMNGYRIPHVIQNDAFFLKEATLVQAYLIDEGEGALPVDQLLLDSPDGRSTFLLPAGKYRTEKRTLDGAVEKGPDFEVILSGSDH